eukprot:2256447-Pleurochrysis_carterae.AAC.1
MNGLRDLDSLQPRCVRGAKCGGATALTLLRRLFECSLEATTRSTTHSHKHSHTHAHAYASASAHAYASASAHAHAHAHARARARALASTHTHTQTYRHASRPRLEHLA